ncbi:MAG: sigma-54-dependent Fis family transcriptional regulator [Deltaproteobacteria bacterium]|nr:sigma-54-dependent Fis family transcriptional regulator [Deltaproteobacteria bacterium]
MADVLIVDDELSMREFLEIFWSREGWETRSASSMREALERTAEREPDVVITDLRMQGGSGLDLLRELKRDHPSIEVIVVTAYASDESAIEALRMGAYDYVQKPFQVDEIRVVVQRAQERQRLLRENVAMRAELTGRYDFGGLIGRSPRMKEIYRLVEQVAPTHSNVLITGESGTGKELVARAIHLRSERADGPFVPIDCSSIPEQLLESELFGYVRGAFTGASTDRRGLFELAQGGTVFFDEIAEVPPSVQVKLLRVLQERVFRRLGERRDRRADVRLVAATNREIEQEVSRGAFREDLFYRLNVIRIHLPPLRERKADIPDLVRHFVGKVCTEQDRAAPAVLPETLAFLARQALPGNVRELENLVERAVALCDGRPIGPELIAEHVQRGIAPATPDLVAGGVDLDRVLAETERRLIQDALVAAKGVKKDAARLLGISFRSIRYRIAKLGLTE